MELMSDMGPDMVPVGPDEPFEGSEEKHSFPSGEP